MSGSSILADKGTFWASWAPPGSTRKMLEAASLRPESGLGAAPIGPAEHPRCLRSKATSVLFGDEPVDPAARTPCLCSKAIGVQLDAEPWTLRRVLVACVPRP